jgi:hypothetical protein
LQLNHIEILIIEQICSNLSHKFGDLNRGGCGVFAKAMNELFKTNTFLYVFEKDSLDQDPPIHVYLKLKRGKFLDVRGFSTKKSAFDIYGWSSTIFESNEDILNVYYQELGQGLFVLDYKEDYLIIKKFIFENYFQLKNDKTILIQQ